MNIITSNVETVKSWSTRWVFDAYDTREGISKLNLTPSDCVQIQAWAREEIKKHSAAREAASSPTASRWAATKSFFSSTNATTNIHWFENLYSLVSERLPKPLPAPPPAPAPKEFNPLGTREELLGKIRGFQGSHHDDLAEQVLQNPDLLKLAPDYQEMIIGNLLMKAPDAKIPQNIPPTLQAIIDRLTLPLVFPNPELPDEEIITFYQAQAEKLRPAQKVLYAEKFLGHQTFINLPWHSQKRVLASFKLSPENFETLRKNIPALESILKKMEAQIGKESTALVVRNPGEMVPFATSGAAVKAEKLAHSVFRDKCYDLQWVGHDILWGSFLTAPYSPEDDVIDAKKARIFLEVKENISTIKAIRGYTITKEAYMILKKEAPDVDLRLNRIDPNKANAALCAPIGKKLALLVGAVLVVAAFAGALALLGEVVFFILVFATIGAFLVVLANIVLGIGKPLTWVAEKLPLWIYLMGLYIESVLPRDENGKILVSAPG